MNSRKLIGLAVLALALILASPAAGLTVPMHYTNSRAHATKNGNCGWLTITAAKSGNNFATTRTQVGTYQRIVFGTSWLRFSNPRFGYSWTHPSR